MKADVLWGFLDQILQSLLNLGVGLLLIYFSAKNEYGLYGIAFSTLLLLVGFSNALVSTQMTVIAPTKEEKIQGVYCASLIIGFFKIFIPLSLLGSLCFMAFSQEYHIAHFSSFVYVSIAVSSPIIFLEIMRRYFYLKLTPKSVFLMDLLYAIIYVIGLLTIIFTVKKDLHIYALAINGIAALISALTFFIFSDMSLKGSLSMSSDSLKETWKDGKWSLGGVLSTWGQIQGYIYVLAFVGGSSIVAEANAARLFLSPVNVLSTSFSKVIMPRLVKLRMNNKTEEAVSIARKILLVMLVAIVLYSLIIILSKDWIIEKFMSKDYFYINILIYLWSFYFFCQAFRINNSILLQAFRVFREITISSLFTALLVLSISLYVVRYYGVEGVILTMSGGELILAAILWKIFNLKKSNC